MRIFRLGSRLAAILAVLGLLCLTSGPSIRVQVAQGAARSITVAIPADINSLDQAVDESFNTASVGFQIFDRLVTYDRQMRLSPMLALSWKRTALTTWRFTLRRGVKFQNGEPFDAAAVKFTIERAAGPKSVVNYAVRSLKTVRIVDKYTVDIVTNEPDALVPNNLSWLYMWPPKATASLGAEFGQKPVGSGPYSFVSWKPGQEVVVRANKAYWGGPPKIDEIRFRVVPEPSTRLAMLQRGEADLITNVDSEFVSQLQSGQRTKVVTILAGRKMVLVQNPIAKPLADVKVRQAINYAIDKDSIVKYVMGGYAEKTPGMMFGVHAGYAQAARSAKVYNFDPTKAKALLADAGYPNGFTIDLYHTVGTFPKDKEIAEAIAEQLGKVGVQVTLKPLEWTAFYGKLSKKELPGLALMRFALFLNDPVEMFKWHIWSKGVQPYFSTPELDQMIERTDTILDPAERSKLFPVMEEYVTSKVVSWVYLFDLKSIFGMSKRLNWQPIGYEVPDLRGASLVER